MKIGDQVKLKVDSSRGFENFKKGDLLTLRICHGDFLKIMMFYGASRKRILDFMKLNWNFTGTPRV